MRKPNYGMERKDRDRAKQAKAAAKLEKRTSKGGEGQDETVAPDAGTATDEPKATPDKTD